MSCCGGSCGCGSSCQCTKGCNGCGMYPDLSYSGESTTTETFIVGVALQKAYFEGLEMMEGDCKCGPNCTCNGCSCHN